MFYLPSPKANNYFEIGKMNSWNYPTHINEYFEILMGMEGSVTIMVNNHEYTVTKGHAVIVFPYQPHGFIKKEDGYGYLCTFSSNLINSFNERYKSMRPCHNMIEFDFSVDRIKSDSNLYAIKSFLYEICNHIVTELKFIEVAQHEQELLTNIFTLTEQKYSEEDFSLQTLANLLHYSYGYISKKFFKQTNIRYNTYLNHVRISHATQMLATSQNIAKIAFACGYDSIRSFNRNFKAVYGISPSEYIKNANNLAHSPYTELSLL